MYNIIYNINKIIYLFDFNSLISIYTFLKCCLEDRAHRYESNNTHIGWKFQFFRTPDPGPWTSKFEVGTPLGQFPIAYIVRKYMGLTLFPWKIRWTTFGTIPRYRTSNSHISAPRHISRKIFSDSCSTSLVLHNPRFWSNSVFGKNPMGFGHPPLPKYCYTH